jgi:hypothetical protein
MIAKTGCVEKEGSFVCEDFAHALGQTNITECVLGIPPVSHRCVGRLKLLFLL